MYKNINAAKFLIVKNQVQRLMVHYTREWISYTAVHLRNENHATMKRNEGNLFILTRKDAPDTLLRKQISKQNRKCESIYTGLNSFIYLCNTHKYIYTQIWYTHLCINIHTKQTNTLAHIQRENKR